MKLLAANCRSLGRASAHKINVDILFLSKTKLLKEANEHLCSKLHFKSYVAWSALGKKRGLGMFWKASMSVQVISLSACQITLFVGDNFANTSWLCTMDHLIINLKPLCGLSYLALLLLIGCLGWCNDTLVTHGRCLPHCNPSASSLAFRQIVEDLDLIDLGFKGVSFTWSNKRISFANVRVRLDRALENSQWQMLFPHVVVSHLPLTFLDHCATLLDSQAMSARLASV